MKKVVFLCDFCGEWVTRDNIYNFKRCRFSYWKDMWVKEKFNMCSDCSTHIRLALYKKRRERGEEI